MNRAHAIAQAGAHLPPGAEYQIGRLVEPAIRGYVPPAEWVIETMRRRAQETHQGAGIQWPRLDARETRELQNLLEGLIVAFFEREGILPDFSERVELENCRVPATRPELAAAPTP